MITLYWESIISTKMKVLTVTITEKLKMVKKMTTKKKRNQNPKMNIKLE